MPWGAEAGTPRTPSLESSGRDLAAGGYTTAALPCGRRERKERRSRNGWLHPDRDHLGGGSGLRRGGVARRR